MADPVLPVLPAAPGPKPNSNSKGEETATYLWDLTLVNRQLFAQNQILIDRDRNLCDQMTAYRAEQSAALQRQEFLTHASAFALAFLAGVFTWRLIVLAKNQRHLW